MSANPPGKYFLINDTSYDNHHGCTTVVDNLKKGMGERGWVCIGTLAVGSELTDLLELNLSPDQVDLFIVNGEGSLHHDSSNASKLLDIMLNLVSKFRLVLINTVWQDNKDVRWHQILRSLSAIYVRDTRSQKQLSDMGIAANFAPDLTFYSARVPKHVGSSNFACTDSVRKSWSKKALRLCSSEESLDFITMFNGIARKKHRSKLGFRVVYSEIMVFLWRKFRIPVAYQYRALSYSVPLVQEYRERLIQYGAVCCGRYHTLCFCLQQHIPFLYVPSNTYKSEALLEDAGLDASLFIYSGDLGGDLLGSLTKARQDFSKSQESIKQFNSEAHALIEKMFDQITEVV